MQGTIYIGKLVQTHLIWGRVPPVPRDLRLYK